MLLLVPVALFIGGIAVWAFRITGGLGDPPAAGLGAVALLLGGAGLLILGFVLLIRRGRAQRAGEPRKNHGRRD